MKTIQSKKIISSSVVLSEVPSVVPATVLGIRKLKWLTTAGFCLMANFALALPVNVNLADADTIADALTGVGPKTAEKIVIYRKKNGRFTAAEDLLKIRGIGEKKLAKFKADVRLGEPVKSPKATKKVSKKG